MKHFDFRRPAIEQRDGLTPSRRKEDLGVYLACQNLKLLRDENAPIESLHTQIDYLYDLVDQVMRKHRPQPDVPGATDTDAAHEQPQVA